MSFLDCDERTAACGTSLLIRDKFRFDGCSVLTRFDNARAQFYQSLARRRPQEFYMKIGRYGTGSFRFPVAFHQEIGGGPVRMAIEQRADYAAVQNAGKCLVMRLGPPFRNDLVAFRKTPNV
jgi:hypothetical protein